MIRVKGKFEDVTEEVLQHIFLSRIGNILDDKKFQKRHIPTLHNEDTLQKTVQTFTFGMLLAPRQKNNTEGFRWTFFTR